MTTVNHRTMSGALGSLFGVISTTAHATSQAVEISASALDVLEQKTIAWRASAKQETTELLAVLEENSEDRIDLAVAKEKASIKRELDSDKDLSAIYLALKAKRKKKGE